MAAPEQDPLLTREGWQLATPTAAAAVVTTGAVFGPVGLAVAGGAIVAGAAVAAVRNRNPRQDRKQKPQRTRPPRVAGRPPLGGGGSPGLGSRMGGLGLGGLRRPGGGGGRLRASTPGSGLPSKGLGAGFGGGRKTGSATGAGKPGGAGTPRGRGTPTGLGAGASGRKGGLLGALANGRKNTAGGSGKPAGGGSPKAGGKPGSSPAGRGGLLGRALGAVTGRNRGKPGGGGTVGGRPTGTNRGSGKGKQLFGGGRGTATTGGGKGRGLFGWMRPRSTNNGGQSGGNGGSAGSRGPGGGRQRRSGRFWSRLRRLFRRNKTKQNNSKPNPPPGTGSVEADAINTALGGQKAHARKRMTALPADPASTPGPTGTGTPTNPGVTVPSDLRGLTEAITAHTSWHPENARDVIAWFKGIGDAEEARAKMLRAHAMAVTEEFYLDPAAAEVARGLAVLASRSAEAAHFAHGVFRKVHADDLRRQEEPRPHERKWNYTDPVA